MSWRSNDESGSTCMTMKLICGLVLSDQEIHVLPSSECGLVLKN